MPGLMLRLLALFAPLCLVVVGMPAQAQVFATVSGEGGQKQVIALLGTGDEAAKKSFETVAASKGFKTGRSKNAAGADEVMMIVPMGGDHDAFWEFYDELKAGRHGALKFDMIVLPLDTDTTKDGYLDSARVWGSSQLARPAQAAGIMGRTRDMKRNAVVLGIIGTGQEPEMAKFEAAGNAAGFSAVRSKGQAGETDVMVLVRRSDDPARFWTFYRESVRGKHGKLAIEMILVPQQYDPAAEDYLDHARVYSSSQIVEP